MNASNNAFSASTVQVLPAPSFLDTSGTALTVIEQPTYEIGRTATELLIKRIQDPTRSTRVVTLKSKLIIRQSCGCKN